MKNLLWESDGAEIIKNAISKKLIKDSISCITKIERKKKQTSNGHNYRKI